jgi:hypothetical protein
VRRTRGGFSASHGRSLAPPSLGCASVFEMAVTAHFTACAGGRAGVELATENKPMIAYVRSFC